MCAMRLFTQAEEQIEANVQRNDDIDSDDVNKDEDDRDGSIKYVATGHPYNMLIPILQFSHSLNSDFLVNQYNYLSDYSDIYMTLLLKKRSWSADICLCLFICHHN